MNKSEKHALGQDKSISFLARSSTLYGDSLITRALILALPMVGSPLDLILSKNGQDYVIKRINIFLEELNNRLSLVEENNISFSDEEALFDFMQSVYENVAKTRSEKKLKRFARLTANCFTSASEWDETEAVIRLVADLTDHHIDILKACVNVQLPPDKPFGEVKVIFLDSETMKGVKPLANELPHLSKPALQMYCSELISRGLLKDEGVGKLSGGVLEMFTATDLSKWLLSKVSEQGT